MRVKKKILTLTLALEPYLLNQCTISTGIILNWFSRSSHWFTGQNTDFKLSFVPHTKLLHGLWRLLGYSMVPLLGMNTCSSKCLLFNKKVTWWTFMRTIALSTHTHKKNQLVTSTNEVLRLNHSKPLDNTRNADMQTNIMSDCLS